MIIYLISFLFNIEHFGVPLDVGTQVVVLKDMQYLFVV